MQENSAQADQQNNNNDHRNNHRNNRNHKKNHRHTANPSVEAKSDENVQQVAQSHPAQKHANNKNRNRNRNRGERKQHQNEQTPPANTSAVLNDQINKNDTLNLGDTFVAPTNSADKLQRPVFQKLKNFSESPEFSQYSEYEEFSFEELYGADDTNATTSLDGTDDKVSSEENSNEPMVEVVGIRFKSSGKTYYFNPKGITLKTGSHAIVETARGLEYGEVAIGNTMVKKSETVPPLRPVIRKATDADVKHHNDNKEKEDEAFRICNEKIIEHELDMKLIDAQYTFDNTKLLFYFTSSGRVDFRELVKDLASVFRTRIELRQIGIRDEAKMVGGLGLCGRPLCCSLFLTDFGQVSIKMAKEQNLSLNSSKISGICGRLMCCLRYEHDTYEYEIKRTPPVDSLVRTVDGVGVVTEINPLAATIKVKLAASPDTPPKSYKREEVSVLKKKENS